MVHYASKSRGSNLLDYLAYMDSRKRERGGQRGREGGEKRSRLESAEKERERTRWERGQAVIMPRQLTLTVHEKSDFLIMFIY